MVRRFNIPQQTWANGAAGAALTKTITMAMHGRCEQIEAELSDNAGSKTLTITVASALGGTIYTKAAIPKNANTVYNANKATADFDAWLADEDCTVTLVLSGDPGVGGATAEVAFLMTEGQS